MGIDKLRLSDGGPEFAIDTGRMRGLVTIRALDNDPKGKIFVARWDFRIAP